MKLLQTNEMKLVGKWIIEGNHVQSDETTQRIDWLVGKVLKRIGISRNNGAWDLLYQDPADGRYWVKTYPHSEAHGGGAPTLICISEEEARKAFDFDYGETIKKPLRPFENRLIGANIVSVVGGNTVDEDEVIKRIKWLVGETLEKVGSLVKNGEVETLYRDPHDGRYWELTVSQGNSQKAPELKCIPEAEAEEKYRKGKGRE